MTDPAAPAPFSLFRHPPFLLYIFARLFLVSAGQMMSVAIGWHVYELTGRNLSVGLVGLAGFLPNLLLSLVAGTTADRFDRRKIVMACIASSLMAAMALAWQSSSLAAIYVVAAAFGAIRTFSAPAGSALVGQLVPASHLPKAIAWQMTIFQGAMLGGPALGGVVYAWKKEAKAVFFLAAIFYMLAFVAYGLMRPRPSERRPAEAFGRAVAEGLRYVWREKALLGAMSLDLFAVLLGGVTALLPAFTKDILREGPETMGILRAAMAGGAGVVALCLALRPIERGVGRKILVSVAIFGLATIALGFSRSVPAAAAAMLVIGAADMVSVVVRHTLIQACTPDAMRGRVSAVAFVFISASNDLGEFESGITAHWWDTVPAILAGGIGSVLIVILWAVLFPRLRTADRFEARPA